MAGDITSGAGEVKLRLQSRLVEGEAFTPRSDAPTGSCLRL